MLTWILRGIRRGIVTTRYPAAGMDGLPLVGPEIDSRVLTKDVAFRVTAVCPTSALECTTVGNSTLLILDSGRCIGCGLCAEAAPLAVRMSTAFELAARSRAGLRTTYHVGEGR